MKPLPLAIACLLAATIGCGGAGFDGYPGSAGTASRTPSGKSGVPGLPDGGALAADAGEVPPGDGGVAVTDGGVAVADGGVALSDAGVAADAGAAPADAGAVPPSGPSLAGCPMFPLDSPWNQRVDSLPVDAHSADYLAFMGAGSLMLHPDFGAPEWGQPFTVVTAAQARVPMSFTYAAESDPGPYPYPPDLPIQTADDRHAAVLDRDHCLLYETYQTRASGAGFAADSGAVYDLRSNLLRPEGWTSATAAGLPILPGMARYDEAVELGAIEHALAFTAGGSGHGYVHPATHSSGTSYAVGAPPMGLRVRLRADFDVSGFHGTSLVVLRALQRYGMFLNDNAGGTFWSVAGSKDPRWPTQDLEQLKRVPVSAFEVVQLGPIVRGQ